MDIGTVSFCGSCGANQQEQQQRSHNDSFNQTSASTPSSSSNQSSETNTFALLGFIFTFVLQPLGFIFCIIGLSKAKTMNGNGRGLALAGLIIGIVEIVVSLIVGVFAVIYFVAIMGMLGGI